MSIRWEIVISPVTFERCLHLSLHGKWTEVYLEFQEINHKIKNENEFMMFVLTQMKHLSNIDIADAYTALLKKIKLKFT